MAILVAVEKGAAGMVNDLVAGDTQGVEDVDDILLPASLLILGEKVELPVGKVHGHPVASDINDKVIGIHRAAPFG
jgi:hypothetical protein